MDAQHKNGTMPGMIRNLAEMSQLSPDGHNLELRIHCVQSGPEGECVLGEVVFRTFRGGAESLKHLIAVAPGLAGNLITQVTSGLVLPVK